MLENVKGEIKWDWDVREVSLHEVYLLKHQ